MSAGKTFSDAYLCDILSAKLAAGRGAAHDTRDWRAWALDRLEASPMVTTERHRLESCSGGALRGLLDAAMGVHDGAGVQKRKPAD